MSLKWHFNDFFIVTLCCSGRSSENKHEINIDLGKNHSRTFTCSRGFTVKEFKKKELNHGSHPHRVTLHIQTLLLMEMTPEKVHNVPQLKSSAYKQITNQESWSSRCVSITSQMLPFLIITAFSQKLIVHPSKHSLVRLKLHVTCTVIIKWFI